MYSNEPYWYDQPRSQKLDRLIHLVLVDGRLVDTWSEPVEGTRWQHHRTLRPRAASSAGATTGAGV